MQVTVTLATSVLLSTTLACVLILVTKRFHGSFSEDSRLGVQKMHTTHTARIGGVAIATGLAISFAFAESSIKAILGPMLLAATPAFAVGLVEDITKCVGIRLRLLVTIFSGSLACHLTGLSVQTTGVQPLDYLLSVVPVAVIFTAFAVGGVVNAVNIIDGFNGLAGGTVVLILAALGVLSYTAGDIALASVCLLVAACTIGFGVANWPFGKIFLGDCGAYLLGFIVAWIAVLLQARNPGVSAFAALLACAYPVIEVGFSVLRRVRRHGHHPGSADKLHLHHLIHYRVSRPIFKGASCRVKNGMTSPFVWCCAALPATLSVLLPQNITALCIGFLVCVLLYSALYRRLAQFGRVFVDKPTQKTKPNLT